MPVNVKQTFMGADMDITHYSLPEDKLKEQILEDVKKTQLFAGRNLPDKLFMTDEQFSLLASETQVMEGSKDRIYITPFNVMEVKIIK